MDQHELSPSEAAVKQTVMDIIQFGSIYDVESLDRIYSDNLQIVRVASDGKTSVLGKGEVLGFFRAMRSKSAEPLSTEAHFNHIEVGDDLAHAVVTRSMKLFGKQEKSVYSLCMAKKESGWKVVKETVVSVA